MNTRARDVCENSMDINYLTREAARLTRMAMATLDIRERNNLRARSRDLRNKIAKLKTTALS